MFYSKQANIVPRLTGRQSRISTMQIQKAQQSKGTFAQQTTGSVPSAKTEKEESEATKVMIEMMKKERTEKERKREDIFMKFGGEVKKAIERPAERITVLEPIKKETPIEKQKVTKLTLPSKEEAKSREFERLSEMSKREKSVNIERLSKLMESKGEDHQRQKRKEEAFEKLSGISKSRVEDVFNKLPKSEKNIDSLKDIERESKKKKKR